MAAALRRLRALGRRRRRPLSLTERSGAGTRGAMAGGRRGAIARPEQSSSYSAGLPPPRPRSLLLASACPPTVPLRSASVQLVPSRCRLTPRADRGSGGDPHLYYLSADWSGLGLAKIAERRRGGGGCHRWSEQADLAGANVARAQRPCNRRRKVTFSGSNVNGNRPRSWE